MLKRSMDRRGIASNPMPSKHRVRKDPATSPATPLSQQIRVAARRGGPACRKQVPRWANPLQGTIARAWTWGWNREHGPCPQCALCLVGTPAMPDGFTTYYHAWFKRNAEREIPAPSSLAEGGVLQCD